MKKISLTQKKHALVDDIDFVYLKDFKWYALKLGGTFYAVRNDKKKKSFLYMHRVIMNTPKGLETDRVNGNGLDNRRKNLRIVTHAENGANRVRLSSNNTSGHRGVYWHCGAKKWMAQLTKKGHIIYLGLFGKKDEAIIAVKNAL